MLEGNWYIRLIRKIINVSEYWFYNPKLKKMLADSLCQYGKSPLILDVGANQGQSIAMFRSIAPDSEILAFEAIPELAQQLKNLDLENVRVFNIVLCEAKGKTPFYISKFHETSTTIPVRLDSKYNKLKSIILGIKSNKMYKEITVNCETVDSIINSLKLDTICLMKIDVEGGELNVLKGAKEALAQKKIHYIQLERHVADLRKNDSKEIQFLLEGFGYIRKKSIRHLFGSVYDDFYSLTYSNDQINSRTQKQL